MKPENSDRQEILGQYATDYILHAGHPGLDDDSLGVKTRGSGRVAFHHPQTLFDENEGVVSEITGQTKKITELDGLLDLEGMRVVSERIVLRARDPKSKKDIADEWMKRNGHSW